MFKIVLVVLLLILIGSVLYLAFKKSNNQTGSSSSLPSNIATTDGAQILTNKDLSSSTNMFSPKLATTDGVQVFDNKTMAKLKVGTYGTTSTMVYSDQFTYAGNIPAGAVYTIGSVGIPDGFKTVPRIFISLKTPRGGSQGWEKVLLTLQGDGSSTKNINILATNLGSGPTSGEATIYFYIEGS